MFTEQTGLGVMLIIILHLDLEEFLLLSGLLPHPIDGQEAIFSPKISIHTFYCDTEKTYLKVIIRNVFFKKTTTTNH